MKARFGMLMTDAVGKAGGQCIQRRGGVRVLRNITIPTQRSGSLNNPQRFTNNFLFTQFSKLTQATRDTWAEIGANTTTKNTWGDDKNLRAREAFLKFNGIVYNASGVLIDASAFDYSVPQLDVTDVQLKLPTNSLTFTVFSSSLPNYYQMKAKRIRSLAVNLKPEKLKTFTYAFDIADTTENFSELELSVGTVKVGDIFSIAVRGVSVSGQTSVWNIFKVVAQV